MIDTFRPDSCLVNHPDVPRVLFRRLHQQPIFLRLLPWFTDWVIDRLQHPTPSTYDIAIICGFQEGRKRDVLKSVGRHGLLLLKHGRLEATRKVVEAFFPTRKALPGLLYVLAARIRQYDEDLQGAISLLRTGIATEEQRTSGGGDLGYLFFTLGSIFLRQQEYSQAEDCFQKAQDSAISDDSRLLAAITCMRGNGFLAQNCLREARTAYLQGIQQLTHPVTGSPQLVSSGDEAFSTSCCIVRLQ